MVPSPLRITILGAGVAGLSTAHLLARDGHRVELVERDMTVPRVGTALALFPHAQRALEACGVLEQIRARAAAPREGHVVDAGGRTLARLAAGGGILVSRSDLVSTLQDTLPAAVHRTHAEVTDVRPLLRRSDVLVGADGVRSLTRRSGWGPRAEARTHGRTILRGTAEIPPPDVSETWGPGWLMGITPLPGERTNWYASIPEHRGTDSAGALSHLRDLVGGRRDEIDTVLAAATPETTLIHGIATVPNLLPVREHAVLIGDAAHAMTPHLGHGANTALGDALALAEELRRMRPGASPRGALRRYAARRHLPDQAWRIGSAATMHLAEMGRGAASRDRMIRALVGRGR